MPGISVAVVTALADLFYTAAEVRAELLFSVSLSGYDGQVEELFDAHTGVEEGSSLAQAASQI